MARETKNILVNRNVERALLRYASTYFSGRLIDIGCGIKPYNDLLEPFVEEHVGVDHEGTFHDKSSIDLFGTAYEIPVEDNSFNSALCTFVLEHLEEPEKAIRECWRVLKRGGIAIYAAPFIWHLHEEPRDFFRYSQYGLTYLFEKAGFEVVELGALSGFWLTFGQLLVYNLYRLNRRPLSWLKIIDLLGLILQGFFFLLDKMDKSEKWTHGYIVVARKK